MSNKRRNKGHSMVFRGPMAAAVLAALAGNAAPKYTAQCARCKKVVESGQPIAAGTVFYCSIECAD